MATCTYNLNPMQLPVGAPVCKCSVSLFVIGKQKENINNAESGDEDRDANHILEPQKR